MSYILDALKKSDRERQRGKVPNLNSVHDTYPASYESHSANQWTKYIFTAVALILLISIPATTWYLRTDPVSSDTPDSVNSDTPVVIEEAQTTITEPEKTTLLTVNAEPKDNESTLSPPPPATAILSKTVIMLPDQTNPPEEKEISVSLPSQKSSDIRTIENLPPAIRTTIPDLHLAGHTYSDNPSKRMIIINNNILREGDRVNNTIKLVEITWTGVILDHNGVHFSVDIE